MAIIPVMVARDSVTAEHGILVFYPRYLLSLFFFFLSSSSSLLLSLPSFSLSSVSFTSHSPRLRGSYCYRRVRGHQRARKEKRRLCREERAAEEKSWTTPLRRILVNAEMRARARLSRISRQVPGGVREKESQGEEGGGFDRWPRDASVISAMCLRRPSGCALRRDAHHTPPFQSQRQRY